MRRFHLYVVIGLAVLITLLALRFPYALDSDHDKASLIKATIFALLLGSAVAARRIPLSTTLKQAGAWLVVILLLVMGYSYKNELMDSRLGATLLPNRPVVQQDGTVSLRMREDGHFYVEARVNGKPIDFMVDTGASEVVLSQADAQRIGLNPDTLSYTQRHNTAGGIVGGAPVRLNQLQIGPYRLRNFRASVNGGGLDTSLLGMSALGALGGVSIQGDVMTIGRARQSK